MKSFKKSVAAAAVVAAFSASSAWGAVLYATSGAGSTLSNLYTIDTTTGTTTLIGAVGFTVNGLTFDSTTGTLYGSARSDGGLLTINTTTGAGSLVGPFNSVAAGCSFNNVLLTANSGGSLFGWCDPSSDDLMSINKVTGQATVVGDAGIGTASHGLAFDNSDTLYMYNGGGTLYTIDTGTGAATIIGAPAGGLGSAHHGDFNPDDNLYYGVGGGGPGGQIDIYNFGTNTYVSSLTLDRGDIMTLAFATDVPEPGTLAILGLGLAGFGFARRRKA